VEIRKKLKVMNYKTRRGFIKGMTLAGIGLPATSAFTFQNAAKKSNMNLPVLGEYDICVLGGSCTGVFAAVRASRLGARVAIIEKQNAFGGVATSGLVNIWHTLHDTEFNKQIIAGMTVEVTNRLKKRDAVKNSRPDGKGHFTLNTQELKIELDELVQESNITAYLHTLFSEPLPEDNGKLTGVIVDNKSGRGIIKAKYFIDATGDADLCSRIGLKTYTHEFLQPPTMCAYIEGFDEDLFNSLLKQHGEEFNIPSGYVWGAELPATSSYMLAGTRIYGVDCSNAENLTKAEFEGRRQIRAIMDMMRKYSPDHKIGLTGLPSYVGIRETRHVDCLYQVSDKDAMYGLKFEDAIANGSYVLDLHHQDKPGITFRYLDGTEKYSRPGYPDEKRRWRDETAVNPTFYQVPLRSLIPKKTSNIIVAGRMLDASMISFSGIRVMVNMNQLGEAAGVTAYLALNQNKSIPDVQNKEVRQLLSKDGSIII
jgi:hypothetical protein